MAQAAEIATSDSELQGVDTSEDTVGEWQPIAPDEEESLEEIKEEHIAEDINWVDDSHAYVTDQAQALTEWLDEFFGDPDYDLENAESLRRLELSAAWESDAGHER